MSKEDQRMARQVLETLSDAVARVLQEHPDQLKKVLAEHALFPKEMEVQYVHVSSSYSYFLVSLSMKDEACRHCGKRESYMIDVKFGVEGHVDGDEEITVSKS